MAEPEHTDEEYREALMYLLSRGMVQMDSVDSGGDVQISLTEDGKAAKARMNRK